MTKLDIGIFKEMISAADKVSCDSYINSPLYYLLTGRKGAWCFYNESSSVVVCRHPHIKERLMIFPEVGESNFDLTLSVLGSLQHPRNGIQLSRFTKEDINNISKKICGTTKFSSFDIALIQEDIMDWRYPVRILDTKLVSTMKGSSFKKIRARYKRMEDEISCISLVKSESIQFMNEVMNIWQEKMILRSKDTTDLLDFYYELLKIIEYSPDIAEGLFFKKNGIPVGYCIWDQVNDLTANSFVNMCDTSISGLADFQRVSLCHFLYNHGIKYLNCGGSECQSLDYFKMKYKPAISLKIFSADISSQKSVSHATSKLDFNASFLVASGN